ncbi:MAG: UDP-N-acetylmuramate--L-alanine ligase, partial [Planctomycetaceae bacterium]|nr:UDP-N-acetylmuramate--L-alanine ligase [Planctomycetaceae bacterium]
SPLPAIAPAPESAPAFPLTGHPMPALPKVAPPLPPLSLHNKAVYMVGIGGCGMSGLARMLAGRGARVSGSDMAASEGTAALTADGIAVDFDQRSGRLPEPCDLVVLSAAIKPDHPQLLTAESRGIEQLTYAEALGRCMVGRTGVAIAGTHGKSTTTSMLSCILSDAGLDPTSIVGATCAQLGGCDGRSGGGFRLGSDTIPTGALAGRPGILLAEACEFNRSFHNYRPVMAAINSVEADHLDIYGTFDAVIESFRHFAGLVAPAEQGGFLLISHEGAHRREVTAGTQALVQTIGFAPDADWSVRYDRTNRIAALVNPEHRVVCEWRMNMPGVHNAMNAATAAVLALRLGAAPERIAQSLSQFRGVDRRCQLLGEKHHPLGGTVRVYDDYGHHPTEVEATLTALRQFEAPEKRNGRLICVFQPHQHSRTRHLMEEFANSFKEADVVIVPHIYFVRDSQEEKQKITEADFVDRLRSKGVKAMHVYPFEGVVQTLDTLTRPNDLLLVMGAGPVNRVGEMFLAAK